MLYTIGTWNKAMKYSKPELTIDSLCKLSHAFSLHKSSYETSMNTKQIMLKSSWAYLVSVMV